MDSVMALNPRMRRLVMRHSSVLEMGNFQGSIEPALFLSSYIQDRAELNQNLADFCFRINSLGGIEVLGDRRSRVPSRESQGTGLTTAIPQTLQSSLSLSERRLKKKVIT